MAVTGRPFTDEQLLQAMLYVCGELDGPTVSSFEAQLLDDVVLCEAVAEATRLTCLLKSHTAPASASVKPVRQVSMPTLTARRQTGTGAKWLAPAIAVALLIAAALVISRSDDKDTFDAVANRSDVTGESDSIEFAEQLADLWSDPASETSLGSRNWPVETQFPEEANSGLASVAATSESDWILLALLPDEDFPPAGDSTSGDDDEIIEDGDEATL